MASSPTISVLEPVHQQCLDRLQQFANVVQWVGRPRPAVLNELATVDAIVVKSLTAVDAEFMDAAPRLRCIARAGTGLENIDVVEAEARGIAVVSVPDGNSQSAAELAVLLMLSLVRNFVPALAAVQNGKWSREVHTGRELGQLSVGLVGIGNVGIRVARFLANGGTTLLGLDPSSKNEDEFLRLGGSMMSSLEELIESADLVSLHVRQTPSTVRMLDRTALARAKPGLLLVNTARGALVDSDALADALDSGGVAGAALDVLSPEPPFDHPDQWATYQGRLVSHPKVIVTPHLGGLTTGAQERIGIRLADAVRAALA